MSKKHHQHDPNPSGHQSEGGEEHSNQEGGGKIRVEAYVPPELVKKYDAANTQQAAREDKKYRLEVITLVVVAFYAALTACLVGLNWQANDLNHRTFDAAQITSRIDQRPYVVTDFPQFYLHGPIADTPIEANITFRNIGKTPAVKIINNVRLLSTVVASRQSYIDLLNSTFSDLDTKNSAAGKEEEQLPIAEQDVAPNGFFFTTNQDKVSISPGDFPKLKTGELYLLYVGVVNYSDAFKESYSTHFCYMYFGDNPSVWHICQAYNTIK